MQLISVPFGGAFDYREAEQNLEKLNCQRRSVNNHTQVKRITDKVGLCLPNRTLFQRQHRNMPPVELSKLMAVIFHQDPEKRSFEALSAIVYRPENLHAVDQHHRQIINKTCVFPQGMTIYKPSRFI